MPEMPLPLIIIPVYNALEHVNNCLLSIEKTVAVDTPVLIIDDASTNAGIQPLLINWVGNSPSNRWLITHTENRGFVATVNEGMEHSQGDVILLNSDTEVYGDWLNRMAHCLASDKSIATATPWSNNGEIVSIPEFCLPNTPPPNPSDFAFQLTHCGTPAYPDLPTAVGFCMAITRTAIDQIGLFDERTFGRGYGEENDFCQRAEKAGFRNVLCDDAYVIHHGGASFGPLGLKPDEDSMQRLLGKHPDYQRQVESFIRNDPLASRRSDILECIDRAGIVMR